MGLASTFLIVFNSITAVLGLVGAGAGIYVLVNFQAWSDLIGNGAVWIGIAAGFIMSLVSFLGCWGAIYKKPNYICIYLFFLFLSLVFGVAGIVLFYGTQGILDIGDSNVGAALVADSVKEYRNGVLSTYAYCCAGCTACVNGDTFPDNKDYCSGGCTEVQWCPESNYTFTCFNAELPEDDVKLPSLISESVCSGWERANVPGTENPIVGDAANGDSCGGGDPAKFANNVFDWFTGYANLLIGCFIAFLVLLLLTFLAGCAVMWQAHYSPHME